MRVVPERDRVATAVDSIEKVGEDGAGRVWEGKLSYLQKRERRVGWAVSGRGNFPTCK